MTSPRLLVTAFAAAAMLNACVHGPRLENLPFVRQPFGAQTTVTTAGGSYTGELITANDREIVVLVHRTNRVVSVPAESLRRVQVEALGDLRVPLRGDALRRVQLVSRHPYGIPDQARAALLAGTGQSEFDTHTP